MCEMPMSIDEKEFAELHHGLVLDFLRGHRLPQNEYYDVVIFAYLEAVRAYFTEPSARKFSFNAIANRRMNFALADYYRAQYCPKRKACVISLQESPYSNGLPLEEILPAEDELMKQLKTKLLLHDLAARISEQQMDIVRLKYNGYNVREIAKHQNLPLKRVQRLLKEVQRILSELCYE